MGEAKRRGKLKHQVLAEYPHCIYCGGEVPATTVDHVPPVALFELRRRPRGLEFPACQACNSGGRLDELVAAMLARIYPDSHTEGASEEVRRLITAVNNNCPGLIEEMVPSFRQKKLASRSRGSFLPDSGVLNCRGRLLNRAIHRFAAKLGYALHFQLIGKPVPPNGAACVWWLTNYQAVKGDMPHQLLDMMGESQTLRQGSWNVGNQFRYASIGTQEGTMSAHFASFRFSFAICAFVAEVGDIVRPPDDISHVTLHKPGWLQRATDDELNRPL